MVWYITCLCGMVRIHSPWDLKEFDTTSSEEENSFCPEFLVNRSSPVMGFDKTISALLVKGLCGPLTKRVSNFGLSQPLDRKEMEMS